MEEKTAATLLEKLIEVTQQGYSALQQQIKDLENEMKEVTKGNEGRFGRLEQFMFTTQGGLAVTRTLAGASFLGAILSIGVALYTGK